jgi:hypothetical protein
MARTGIVSLDILPEGARRYRRTLSLAEPRQTSPIPYEAMSKMSRARWPTKKPGVAAGLLAVDRFALSSRRLQIARRLLAALGDDFEADLLAFSQRPHAGLFDRRDVHEHILGAIIRLDKTETFLGIEELHSSDGHRSSFQR